MYLGGDEGALGRTEEAKAVGSMSDAIACPR
jgi:hypothetical protein